MGVLNTLKEMLGLEEGEESKYIDQQSILYAAIVVVFVLISHLVDISIFMTFIVAYGVIWWLRHRVEQPVSGEETSLDEMDAQETTATAIEPNQDTEGEETELVDREMVIIDNIEETVESHFTQAVEQADQIKIAVGRFSHQGILQVWDAIRTVDQVQLLIGPEVGRETRDILTRVYEHNPSLPETESREEQEFYEWVHEERLAIRVYTGDERFHPKLYLLQHFDRSDADGKSTAIFGSSNFSVSGFQTNVELNAQFEDSPTYGQLEEWFAARWEESESFHPDLLEVEETDDNEGAEVSEDWEADDSTDTAGTEAGGQASSPAALVPTEEDLPALNVGRFAPELIRRYKEDIEWQPPIQRLLQMDEDIADRAVLGRHLGGRIGDPEWGDYFEEYYSEMFNAFLLHRLRALSDTVPGDFVPEEYRGRFADFRERIADVNASLGTSTDELLLPGTVELALQKQLRRQGCDLTPFDLSYIDRGGGLYLLELFVAAAYHELTEEESEVFTTLLEEVETLTADRVREILSIPVLLVDELWPNQEEGLERWLAADREGILEMATATGKTVAGLAAIAYLCGVLPQWPEETPEPLEDASIMVVAHSRAILHQWRDEVQEKLGLPAAASDGLEPISFDRGRIEFRTVHSLLPQFGSRPDLAEPYDLVIYDEVHHYARTDGFGQAISDVDYRAALGLSATIGEEGGVKRSQLESLLGEVVYTYTFQDAQQDEIIPEFDWMIHPTVFTASEREEWDELTNTIQSRFMEVKNDGETQEILRELSSMGAISGASLESLGDFIQVHREAEIRLSRNLPDSWAALHRAIQQRNWIRHRSHPKQQHAIDLAREYLENDSKCVIFTMNIDVAEDIAAELRKTTGNVHVAHSDLSNQQVKQNIRGFKRWETGALIAPKLLDEGLDIPDARVGINVAGTKTKLQLIQRMGRVLRKYDGQNPIFHHFVAVSDYEQDALSEADAKEFAQNLIWIHELGEQIKQQPKIRQDYADPDAVVQLEAGEEEWGQALLEDNAVETVRGPLKLEDIYEGLTGEAAAILMRYVDPEGEALTRDDWKAAVNDLRDNAALEVPLHHVWWLFPLYQHDPEALHNRLSEIKEQGGP